VTGDRLYKKQVKLKLTGISTRHSLSSFLLFNHTRLAASRIHSSSFSSKMLAQTALSAILAFPLFVSAVPLQITQRTLPPEIPSLAEAKTLLTGITVAAQGPQTGYSRSEFKTWDTIEGTCNTREWVLKRDGSDVVVNSACTSTSGSWLSPYDGATWTSASDLDIDHFIPLSNAWKSGAAQWTAAQREAFANDVKSPQLWAITASVNESKSDSGPEDWLPPLKSFYCTYGKAWIKVKNLYDLTITSAEKTALESLLDTC